MSPSLSLSTILIFLWTERSGFAESVEREPPFPANGFDRRLTTSCLASLRWLPQHARVIEEIKRLTRTCKCWKLFEFYPNKNRRNSLNRPRPTISLKNHKFFDTSREAQNFSP